MNKVAIKPLITEKSIDLASKGTYVFEVPTSANKLSIADVVSRQFKVEVTGVRTSTIKGKVKRFRGYTGRRSDKKRAFVNLKKGQKIAAFEEQK